MNTMFWVGFAVGFVVSFLAFCAILLISLLNAFIK